MEEVPEGIYEHFVPPGISATPWMNPGGTTEQNANSISNWGRT